MVCHSQGVEEGPEEAEGVKKLYRPEETGNDGKKKSTAGKVLRTKGNWELEGPPNVLSLKKILTCNEARRSAQEEYMEGQQETTGKRGRSSS